MMISGMADIFMNSAWLAYFLDNDLFISIEKEQYNPSLMLAYRMAEIFNVSIEDLCCLKENKELDEKLYEEL